MNERQQKAGNIITYIALIGFILLAAVAFLIPGNSADSSTRDYVTLGNYKGLSVSARISDVTDVAVDEMVQSVVNNYGGSYVNSSTETVASGDQVIVHYQVAQNGESSVDLEHSSEAAINADSENEFGSQLIGYRLGDTVSVSVNDTNYLVYIEHINVPSELTDELVASFGIDGISTVSALRESSREYLTDKAYSDYETAAKEELIATVYNGCTFSDIPEEELEPYKDVLRVRLDNAVSAYKLQGLDYTYDDILADTYQKDNISSIDEYLDIYALQDARIYAICKKIADIEDIKSNELDVYSLAASDWANVKDSYSSFKEFIEKNDISVYERTQLLNDVKDYLFEVNCGEN